ncbi:hypothetical protein D9M68_748730 [compost metagenome]
MNDSVTARRSGFWCGFTFCVSQRLNSTSSSAAALRMCAILASALLRSQRSSGCTKKALTRSSSAWVMVCGAPSFSMMSAYSASTWSVKAWPSAFTRILMRAL